MKPGAAGDENHGVVEYDESRNARFAAVVVAVPGDEARQSSASDVRGANPIAASQPVDRRIRHLHVAGLQRPVVAGRRATEAAALERRDECLELYCLAVAML